MGEKRTLKEKYQIIFDKVGTDTIFVIQDVIELFPDKTKQSVYWDLSKLTESGYLTRVRNGIYMISNARKTGNTLVSSNAKKIIALLQETGFDFYISGIDVLSQYLHHVPENYPTMLFLEKAATEEIKQFLFDNQYTVVDTFKTDSSFDMADVLRREKSIVIKPTDSFAYAQNNLAAAEKAFIDLFYEITRENFPFALQELVRVYQNMIRNGAIDPKRLVKISYVRNLQYDIRYIVESKYISEEAKQFVSILRKE